MKKFAVLTALAVMLALLFSSSSYGQAPPSGAQTPWTIAGVEGGPDVALMGADGAVQPSTSSFALRYRLLDPATKLTYGTDAQVAQPAAMQWRLQDGYMPIPTGAWKAGEISVLTRLFVKSYGPAKDKTITFSQIRLKNEAAAAKQIVLNVAVLPGSIAGKSAPINSIRPDQKLGVILVNDKLALALPETKAACTFSLGAAKSKTGAARAEIAYRLTLKPGETVSLAFKMPMTAPAPSSAAAKSLRAINANDALGAAVAAWQKRLGAVKISTPDPRYGEAFRASLGYILATMRGDRLSPGPGTDHFRYRDATYMVHALDVAGMQDVATKALKPFVAFQQPDGYFPPEVDGSGKPVGPKGWDAQSQALFILGRHYRYTQDKQWLTNVFPKMEKGGNYLIETIKRAQTLQVLRTPVDGLLPAGYSGKDLGNENWHRYWDNCWAIGGLYELMWSAGFLEKQGLHDLYGQAGNDLNTATSQSYLRVRVKYNLMWVPNAPEEIYTAAAAESAMPGAWPTRSLNFMDPMVNQSFLTYYWRKWIEPNGGGFVNNGRYQPYVSFGLGHGFMYFDHAEMALPIIEHGLNNQTAPGVYAWAAAADLKNQRFDGEMPSGWAAAEYVNLLRDLLIREDRQGLTLISGVPEKWLDDGKTISCSGISTYWGKTGFTLTSHAGQRFATLKITGPAEPPNGYLLKWPLKDRPVRGCVVDGKILTRFSGTIIALPSTARDVRLEF